MKVTYQTCCGVDVHKSFLVATIIKTTGGNEPSYQKQRFSTFNNSILKFKQWLLDNECRDVCMESTGKYWIPVFNLLEDDINVTTANPKWVKAVKGNKDDAKDSKWIGDLFRLGLVRGSIDIDGKDVFKEQKAFRTQFGVIFNQKPSFLIDLKVMDNLVFFKEMYRLKDKDFKERLKFCNRYLDIQPLYEKQYRKLSYGERTKCEIVSILLHSPRYVFMDEPTNGLDVTSKCEGALP